MDCELSAQVLLFFAMPRLALWSAEKADGVQVKSGSPDWPWQGAPLISACSGCSSAFCPSRSPARFCLRAFCSPLLGIAPALEPLVYFAFDMLENAQIAALLRAGSFSDRVAEQASRWTMLKAQALRFSLAVILLPLARQAFGRVLGRKENA